MTSARSFLSHQINRRWKQAAAFEKATRPVSPEEAKALQQRWDELPTSAQTPSQLLGKRSTGCEATHGVFPKCNFACKPCYHSAEANQVRVDGDHTIKEVKKQMHYLQEQRGFGQFAQLIGGEVSLLDPNDHAEALTVMRQHGRMPMSFTHGDFSYDYLRKLALNPDGSNRFNHLAFAAHFDTTMIGRSGIKKPSTEAELNDHRAAFCAMFDRLRNEHGITSYLAHNMTVTPENLNQVAEVIRSCHSQGWRLFSFQPAAYIGNQNRWGDQYQALTSNAVWTEVERGANNPLPYKGLRFGDIRCNRVTWGAYLNNRYTPIIDDQNPADLAFANRMIKTFPGSMVLQSKLQGAGRIVRSLLRHPLTIPHGVWWLKRFVSRAGGWAQDWRRLQPVTFVMHQFIDATDSAAAWDHIQKGTQATEPAIIEAQERLEACAYSMAHPETDQLVPACVQHGVLDQQENSQLVDLLPLTKKHSTPNTKQVRTL